MIERAIANLVAQYARSRPGWLLSAARTHRDLVPELRQLAFGHLHRIPPSLQEMARRHILQQGRESLRAEWVPRIAAALRELPGEVGDVARAYPAWLDDHLRRLANLVWLWAEGSVYERPGR